MAISQVARERQRLRDQTNSNIRKGFGKASTNGDLVNSVMQAGGSYITRLASETANQVQVNTNLDGVLDNFVIVAGKDGTKVMTDGALQKLASILDSSQIKDQPLVQGFSSILKTLDGDSIPFRNNRSVQDRIDGNNQKGS